MGAIAIDSLQLESGSSERLFSLDALLADPKEVFMGQVAASPRKRRKKKAQKPTIVVSQRWELSSTMTETRIWRGGRSEDVEVRNPYLSTKEESRICIGKMSAKNYWNVIRWLRKRLADMGTSVSSYPPGKRVHIVTLTFEGQRYSCAQLESTTTSPLRNIIIVLRDKLVEFDELP
jgi:hypothetical protein